jgi:hypothetical protein
MNIEHQLAHATAAQLKAYCKAKGRKRGQYRKYDRPARSSAELLSYARQNKITSRPVLLKVRKDGDPMPWDYIKVFGSWAKAMSAAGQTTALQFDRKYLVSLVVEFGLWTKQKYEEAHKKRPDIVPSLFIARKTIGSWAALKSFAMAFSVKESMRAYIELGERLGKIPTREECRYARVDLSAMLAVYGKKKELDQFVSMIRGLK